MRGTTLLALPVALAIAAGPMSGQEAGETNTAIPMPLEAVSSGASSIFPVRPLPLTTSLSLTEPGMTDAIDNRSRDDALLNGALISLGALGIFDNVVIHWILGWHRAIEDSPYALEVEIGIVAVSAAMLAAGVVRERRARRR